MANTALVNIRSLQWNVLAQKRHLPHLQRKLYHLVMGVFSCFLYAFFLSRMQALLILGVVGGVFIALDISRLCSANMNSLALRLFGKIMRREELRSITGNSFYILGMLTVVYFFEKPVVLMSVMYLAVGDPVAAIVGTRFGRHKILAHKSLEGSFANFAACLLAGLLICGLGFGFPAEKSLAMVFWGAMISTIVELLPLPIDDNFSIPVLSALAMALGPA